MREHVVSTRLNDGEAVRVSVAAASCGKSRAEYVREIVIRAADDDLARIGPRGHQSNGRRQS